MRAKWSSKPPRSTAHSSSRCATLDPVSPRPIRQNCFRSSSRPTMRSPARRAAPAWGSPYRNASSKCTAAKSGSSHSSARARRLPSRSLSASRSKSTLKRNNRRQGDRMKLPRRQFLHLAAGAAALPAVSPMAMADTYPARPITMIVPYAIGGPADAIAHTMADRMGASLHQTVVVENITGAGGSTGVGHVARAVPDGYTIGIGNWGSNVANGALYTLPYDLLTDFEPVSMLPSEPNLILAKTSIAASNLQDLIAWLKANAAKATGGTSGVGGPSHVAGILFQQQTD